MYKAIAKHIEGLECHDKEVVYANEGDAVNAAQQFAAGQGCVQAEAVEDKGDGLAKTIYKHEFRLPEAGEEAKSKSTVGPLAQPTGPKGDASANPDNEKGAARAGGSAPPTPATKP